MNTNQATGQAARRFAEEFAAALGKALADKAGDAESFEVLGNPGEPPSRGNPFQFRIALHGALSGECFVEIYEPQASEMAAKAAERSATEPASEPAEVLGQILAAAAGDLAASLSERLGTTTINVDSAAGLAFGGMFVVSMARRDDPVNTQILLYFGGPVLEALAANPGFGLGNVNEPQAAIPSNLKLVMDVELNVSLRFGQREMPLREVLELAGGAVVELDRMVDDPVELYLDGKLIARGEAVVVDGNYGLRVTEIPQPLTSHLLS